jgi:hypothetical protein
MRTHADARTCADAPRAARAQPCRLVSFAPHELPPLYMRAAAASAAGSGAWQLAWGVGPPALEVEADGCSLRRAALRPFGVLSPPLATEGIERAHAAHVTAALHAHLCALPHEEAARVFASWLRLRPLLENWAQLGSSVAA